MRDIAMLGLTVTPTGEFQGATTAAERESMLATCYRAADEGPGAILPQISPRPISACMGIELPDSRNPFSRHPTFQALKAEGLGAQEIKERLKTPEAKAALMEESAQGLGARWFPEGAAELRVLRGEPGEYEITDPAQFVAGQAEAAGLDVWEFAYEELVQKESMFSKALTKNAAPDGNLDPIFHDLKRPITRCALGDSGAHLTSLMDGGFFPWFLAHFCRDRTLGPTFSIEEAVKILTSDNAELYNLEDRGLLKVGLLADINVIDGERIMPQPPCLKYDLPAGSGRLHQQPVGIEATIKSGVVIMEQGEETGEMPGKLLRGPQSV